MRTNRVLGQSPKKKRAETLYQSFSPFMSTIQKIENDEGASVDG